MKRRIFFRFLSAHWFLLAGLPISQTGFANKDDYAIMLYAGEAFGPRMFRVGWPARNHYFESGLDIGARGLFFGARTYLENGAFMGAGGTALTELGLYGSFGWELHFWKLCGLEFMGRAFATTGNSVKSEALIGIGGIW